ncbi:hypothetical protein ABT158_49820 [Nonomuraea sp. NPDC001636]|uniref:hypothetical protein n=1 Tax=Nonomuraea sp. NPDC001636 TaxID=3154391 RepID=UPI0033315402
MNATDDSCGTWKFITHHARVLIEIARAPEARTRDIAVALGITSHVRELRRCLLLGREGGFVW